LKISIRLPPTGDPEKAKAAAIKLVKILFIFLN
jgi:hypothetical protein